MSKRLKMMKAEVAGINSQESTSMPQALAKMVAAQPESASEQSPDAPFAVKRFNESLLKKEDDEVGAKLEQFDSLSKQVVALTEENSKLTDSIAEYLEKIDTLNEKIKQLKSKDASASCQSSNESNEELVKKIEELEKKNRELQAANDSYLMKISDLSFENARLSSSLQNEMSKENASQAAPKKAAPNAPFNIYRDTNGYSSWN